MNYDRNLKIGDLEIHRLGFGAMRLTGYRPAADRTEPIRVARQAVELGIDFIDTADAYGIGANEELLAEALHPYADGLVIATKVGHTRPSRGEWIPLGRPEYLRQAAELCLRRLRVERLDLLQLHRIDPAVPLDDQIGALRHLQFEGKVRHVGLSEVTVEQLEQARRVVGVVSVQNRYNLTDREHDDVLGYCTREGIAFIPWLPIANGTHARRGALSTAGSSAGSTDASGNVPGDVLTEIASEVAATPAQVSLAWLLHRSPVVVPIPGTSSAEHLAENMAAARLSLSSEQMTRLDALA
jgi:pyridoxine 4-dehydrogenase